LDFTSIEDKEGLGSLYDRHRERVRSVDNLIGKWDGTGQDQGRGRGKDRIIKNKKQKHVAFYFVVQVCMQQFL
jgi:hypothetical protein